MPLFQAVVTLQLTAEDELGAIVAGAVVAFCAIVVICVALQEDAQKGPCSSISGSSWKVHPEPMNISATLWYGNVSCHSHKFRLNEVAPLNMLFAVVTDDNFQELMSPPKDFAPKNMLFMFVTFATVHDDRS